MRFQMLTATVFLCAFLLATSCSDASKSGESTTDSGNAPRPAPAQSLPSVSLPPQVSDKARDFILTTLDRQAIVRFAKVSKTHGDRASVEEVLSILDSIEE